MFELLLDMPMDVARCTLDNVRYTATNFAKLPETDLSKKRKFLVCAECEGAGFFRKASRSGQAACFGARPHKETCSFATNEHERSDTGSNSDKDAIVNSGQRILLDLNLRAQTTKANHTGDESVGEGTGSLFTGTGGPSKAAMSRRPSSILRTLCSSDQFQTSQQTFEIPGKGEFIVADFFVNFAALMPNHDDQYRGYWGRISDLRMRKGTLWLNAIGSDNTSICIPPHLVDAFNAQFRKTNGKDWPSFALVIGTLKTGHGGKRYIRVDDLTFMAVR